MDYLMRKMSKMLCLIISAVLLLTFSACAKAQPVLLSYEGMTFSSAQYAFALAERKGQIVDSYYDYTGKDVSSDLTFWQTMSDGKPYSEVAENGALEFCKLIIITDYFCNLYKLEIIDETVIKDLDKLMEDIINDFGGEDLLSIELAKYGITIKELRHYYESYERIKLLKDYWYGEKGDMKIPESKVKASFLENYYKVDVMFYSFFDSSNQFKMDKEITEEEAREYFDEKYVKVQHILYSTVDRSGNALSDEEVALAKQKATEAYNAIIAGEASFEDKKADNEDSGTEYVFTYGAMVDEFEEASFEMAVGDIRLVETEFGFHIINKLEIDDKDFEGKLAEVNKAISKDRMTAVAEAMYQKLLSGKAEFVKSEDDAEYYFFPDAVFTDGEMNGDELEDLITEMEIGEIVLHKIVYQGVESGYYIIRRTELTDVDVNNNYKEVEDKLINEAFYIYIETFFDSIVVNQEEFDKFDIITTVSFPYYY
ncbi:MAG: hypothetical protein CVU97_01020 [Firmicutes bacterium HGW-Firmicutes-21]|nr:MAG: hypothetical protein CVU97_01020 [Firmicutes bacterium HGW-Firmicutes-21]